MPGTRENPAGVFTRPCSPGPARLFPRVPGNTRPVPGYPGILKKSRVTRLTRCPSLPVTYRYIVLANRGGTCEGDLCRLDISFSDQLYKLKKTWKSQFHAANGFDRSEICKTSNPRISSGSISDEDDTRNRKESGDSVTQCCGSGLERHIFRSDRMECCKDGLSKPIGTC